MHWMNNRSSYGIASILLHWLMAIVIFALFALGWWMTGLDYYHGWYKQAPWLHKSIGIILFAVLLFRLVLRFISPPPESASSHKPWEVKLARLGQIMMYVLLFMIMISGYLISTADSRPVDVFGWFSVPATITTIPEQEDVSGDVHFFLACSLIGLVSLHAMAALKHHFIDRDMTLARMLGR